MTSTESRLLPQVRTRRDSAENVVGEFASLDGEEMYVVRGIDRMPAFLMSIVSDSDHWMYASTQGGLAAGRVDADRSLFPYETDDRLYRAGGATGPFTLLRVATDTGPVIWEPFTDQSAERVVERNLYKSLVGNSVVFEELHPDLGLTFRYRWSTSSSHGFIRTSTLIGHAPSSSGSVEILDGLLNVLPANVPLGMQQSSSTLVEAYRRNEVDPETGLAIYSLESRITDRTEPAESMHANIVWSLGLIDGNVLLSLSQVDAFRAGRELHPEQVSKGVRGHYLLNAAVDLDTAGEASWMIIADVHQSHRAIEERRAQILEAPDLTADVVRHIEAGTDRLRQLIDSADGSQCTADEMATSHHFANTLFNSMRGGVFVDNGTVPIADLISFLETRNWPVLRAHADWLESLGESISHRELVRLAEERDDPALERLCHEYLPITFSRRHGDPSRPWNRFAINVRDENGQRVLGYQGNWRDIFQNWEALCYSFPEYLESIVAKFLNASTVDGFNPYRITREGIDWEVPDPEDTWSNIGYWGDHQIVYLLRLLEASEAYHPGALDRLLNRPIFSYADVPYRLRPYDAIVRNSKVTIDYDDERSRDIDERVVIGSDGRLVVGPDGNVLHVTMAEKLLVPILAKLANLVVGAGIWMNTQRPEWNDANNALVGYGASMVTLAYLRRHLDFCERLFARDPNAEYVLSAEVADWLHESVSVLSMYAEKLEEPSISDRRRKRLLDVVGGAFSDYRGRVYEHGLSAKATVPAQEFIELCRIGRAYADHSIRSNRRESGLYEAYNLVRLDDSGREMRVDHLSEMLEGQVAMLSAGVLPPADVLELVNALYESQLYRADQDSFMLYPARELPSFLDRNVIPAGAVEASPLLTRLIEEKDDSVIERDAFGTHRFAPWITSAAALTEALDRLSEDPVLTDLVAANRHHVYETFEEVFHHERFTGRSGSMYKYEGLGSIYWHMVSKLLLAVQETYWTARSAGEDADVQAQLAAAYYRVRAGLSADKTPRQYGAFPMDPYSHSPGHMGAQQPGMTGQVKEEILTRWGELGVRISGGSIDFDPALLRRREFLDEERTWRFVDRTGSYTTVTMPAGSLGFTFCQVPIVYQLVDGEPSVKVTTADGATAQSSGSSLDRETCAALFERSTSIVKIEVAVPESAVTIV